MSYPAMTIRRGRDGELWTRVGDLRDQWVDTPHPELEQLRRYWGTSLTPEVIELVLCQADYGYMRDLTDLSYEALRIDPTFSMLVSKRMRAAVTAAPIVVPATGAGIDATKAQKYADAVEQQLRWIPTPRQVALRLNWGHAHGRACAEKIWRENPGGEVRWRIDRINWVHPRRLAFGPERELRIRDDHWGGRGFEARGLRVSDYPYKFMTFTPQQFDDYPEREGFLQRGLYFTFFKRFTGRERLILMEVYGRPWRRLGMADTSQGIRPSTDELNAAAEAIDEAGPNATGVEPPGMKITTEQPVQGAGAVHENIIGGANDELAKLVLGEVRTTDAKPSALGSAGDAIAQEVSNEVKTQDCWNLSDLWTDQFAADIIALNFGADELDHCPRIEFPYEAPPNRTEEVDRATKAFSLGVPLKEDEVYERIGFTRPAPGDRVLKQAAPAAVPGFPGGGGAGGLEEGIQPEDGDEDDLEPEGDDGSPLGEGGDSDLDIAARAQPPDYLALARAAHVLELTSYLGAGRVRRYRIPKRKPKTEP